MNHKIDKIRTAIKTKIIDIFIIDESFYTPQPAQLRLLLVGGVS
jgi:hypothetical protein